MNSTREEVTLCRLAFEDHCELCDAVQRRHGNADEADDGPLASRARKVENTVGGPGRRLDERPGDERGTTIYRRDSSVSAPGERARDVR